MTIFWGGYPHKNLYQKQRLSGYLAEANTGAIEFLLVAPAFRGMGIAKKLLDFTEATLQADAKSHLGRDLNMIVGEMNDPFKITTEDDNVDPFVRAKIWHKWGYQKLDFPYIQPALSENQTPVYHLLLMGKIFNNDYAQGVPASLIKLIVHEYVRWAMRIENPEQCTEYQAMGQYLGIADTVGLTPLANYVGYDETKPFLVREVTGFDHPDLNEVINVYKNTFSEGAVTALPDDFIHLLSTVSSKPAGFNYHLWGYE
ncbi:MAG: GNAT family N-acetyltransferase [Methylococcales bacterium]